AGRGTAARRLPLLHQRRQGAQPACRRKPDRTTSMKLDSHSPIDGALLGEVEAAGPADVAAAIGRAHEAFLSWRLVPPPRRGELVRLLGEVLREEKDALGRLVSRESGKILSEGLGEVQQMIDICDFAVGLSRQ